MSATKIEYEGIVAKLFYDDVNDPSRPGWYAEYFDEDGLIGDSEKTWHEEMPTRRNASTKAETIVRRELRRLAKERADRAHRAAR